MNSKKRFILCASDFSSHAADAAGVAAKLAMRRGEKLVLAHATTSLQPSERTTLERQLQAEVKRLQRGELDAEPVLLTGAQPAEAMAQYIRQEEPSLVVVGRGLKGPMDRWALGSFSEAVAESSSVPTLVVRNPAAFESWDWTKERLSILLAVDLNPSSDVVLRWAKQFQFTGPCDVVVCHINWRTPSATQSVSEVVNPPVLQQQLERDLRKKVRDQVGDDSLPIVVRPYFGDPGPCIVEMAAEKHAQLIAIGTHQRHGLHRLAQFSVSREVLHQALINVVCIPLTARFDAREAHIPDFRRVLVATDFSDLGNTAVLYACAACAIGGLVKIIHVALPRTLAPLDEDPSASPDLIGKLRALIPHETGARCQPPQVEVVEESNVARAICTEADRFGADLVCIASHGSGVSQAVHGSVTKAVLKRINRPLLVVRRQDE